MLNEIRELSNDMMKSLELNALVNGDMYAKDVSVSVKEILETRKSFEESGILEELIESGSVPPSPFLPLSVCGTTSNVLCRIFFDTEKFGYRFDFENRKKEEGYTDSLMLLGAALKKRSDEESYILRVDNTSHSYVLYLPPSEDDAYLMQSNAGESMSQFTLQDWMNDKKSTRTLKLSEHIELLQLVEDLDTVPAGKLQEAVLDFFAFSDSDKKKKFKPFKPSNMTYIFRSFDEGSALANLKALYKRAGL